ncbi:MAG: hypothetical protein OEY14_09345, partial [Myxococcales bacterium]|nr:hypothetical protein [Myxococcales bacterium]
PEIAFMLRRRWGPEDAEGLFRVRSSNLAFLVEEVLRLGPRVELLAPPAAREAVAAALRAALEAHGALR